MYFINIISLQNYTHLKDSIAYIYEYVQDILFIQIIEVTFADVLQSVI
jgi:hypothetical protein